MVRQQGALRPVDEGLNAEAQAGAGNAAGLVTSPSAGEATNRNASQAKASRQTKASGVLTAVFAGVVSLVLYLTWIKSEEEIIIPGSGLGYWLGIAGSLTMLALILYPIRKMHARNQKWGRIASWFKVHMVMGIAGPALVIIHTNYSFKAVNSIVATIAMLTVVASGLIGRFLYSKVHRGLYGAKADAKVLLNEASAFSQAIGTSAGGAADVISRLRDYEAALSAPSPSLSQNLKLMFTLGYLTRRNRKMHLVAIENAVSAQALRQHLSQEDYKDRLTAARKNLDLYNGVIRKAAGFKFYDRLLSWWHVLHMPLYFLLIVAAIVHVIAVHLY